ncbi:unnamed protein product [Protopolystoma xenopodis]|uniref:Uncharacterized protein n=1 Tax=Protopolystoma xenopodis TaxID=117903 RepID=A0A3S5BUW1_9PLAT|nr:unnamed protein product [Protopolystoma xenopodis]
MADLLLNEIDTSRLKPNAESLADWLSLNSAYWIQNIEAPSSTRNLDHLTSSDLKTDRDRALAILMAWRAFKGTEATGK